MKRIDKILIFIICAMLISAFTLSACDSGDAAVIKDDSVIITFIDNQYITLSEKRVVAEAGSDITVFAYADEGMTISQCSYSDSSLIETDDGIRITLYNVIYSQRVELSAEYASTSIVYNLNGGSFTDGFGGDTMIEACNLNSSGRTNTAIGTDKIYREGYVLTGWNTSSDGGGVHIGLGSRVTVESGLAENALTLYAEWEKETDVSLFEYEVQNGSATLIKYTGGSTEKLVIPAYIGGYEVTAIGQYFAKDMVLSTLILPCTILTVKSYAFYGTTEIAEIYFSDNITDLNDLSFGKTAIKTWHINAVQAPRYRKDNPNSQFTENVDHMIALQGTKKLLFFGGCSMSYGLDSEQIAEAYPGYNVLNLGVIGGINAGYQFDIITNFIEDGDILVHAPEEGSPYQLMYDYADAEWRMFITVEGNYDLLSLADMSVFTNAFSAFKTFNSSRESHEATDYGDYPYMYNSYGDIVIEGRENTGEDISYSGGEYRFQPSYVTEESVARLSDKYDAITAKGATVYFSFAPINYNSLSVISGWSSDMREFEEKCISYLSQRGYTVISSAQDYVLLGRYFYDEDYHLNCAGAELRTENIIEDLGQYI